MAPSDSPKQLMKADVTNTTRKIPVKRGKRGKLKNVTVSSETATVVMQSRNDQTKWDEIVTFLAKNSEKVLPELFEKDFVSEVLGDDRMLAKVITAILIENGDRDKNDDELDIIFQGLIRVTGTALGKFPKANKSSRLGRMQAIHKLVMESLQKSMTQILKEDDGQGDREFTAAQKSTRAYIMGMAIAIIPYSAYFLEARLDIDIARRRHFIKTITSGTISLLSRVATAIATHGLTEASGVGAVVSEAAKFLSDPVGDMVAKVSVRANKVETRTLRSHELNFRIQKRRAEALKLPEWEDKQSYLNGYENIKDAAEDISQVRIYGQDMLAEETKDAYHPSVLELAPATVRRRGVALRRALHRAAVGATGDVVQQFRLKSDDKRSDPDFVLEYVKKDGQVLGYAQGDALKKVEIVTVALQTENELYKRIENTMKEVERRFKYPETPFIFAHESIKSNPKQLLDWIKLDARVFQQVGEIGEEKDFQMKALKANEAVVDFATPKMLDDEDFALEVIKLDGAYYQRLSDGLRSRREFRLACCRLKADTVIDMIDETSNLDCEFILDALEVNPAVINWLPDKLLEDSKFLLRALRKNPKCWFAFQYDLEKLSSEAWITAVMELDHAKFFPELEESDRDDPLYAKPALDIDPLLLEHAGPSIRANHVLCVNAVKKDRQALEFVSPRLKSDPEFIAEIQM